MSDVLSILDTMQYGPAPESANEALAWLDTHHRRFDHYIGGDRQPACTGGAFESLNPATGEPLATVALGAEVDIHAAVTAARAAAPAWARTSGFERARRLYALARGLQRHARLFAVLETLDNGKPIRESRDVDLPLAIRHFYHHAGWAQLLADEFPNWESIGVVGQIIPWNFPLLMLAWKVAPALAAGNTIVLKPAESTPLTALLFAEICAGADVPPGVVNIVTGDGRTGEALLQHPGVDKIAFTGSTQVGRRIRRVTAGSGKALSLELGGKSPFVVFADADLDAAIEGVVNAIWLNQGEVCCAGSRLLVAEEIESRFMEKLRRRMSKLRVGDPLDKSIDIGAIASREQLARIQDIVDSGVRDGASLWQPDCQLPPQGCFFPPTLCTDVPTSNVLMQEEIFGPVLVTTTFRTPGEAVQLANNTVYGLAASVWSENINLALDIAPKLKCGVVWINDTNRFDAACGFGGYRQSGFGREGGREGMYEYMKPKWMAKAKPDEAEHASIHPPNVETAAIDRTAKLFIGGRQKRPDSGYTRTVTNPKGDMIGEVGQGNRKDIRDAVTAAKKAEPFSQSDAHLRAQVIYYLAENLSARQREFAARIRASTGITLSRANREVDKSLQRLFYYAAYADKFDGAVHSPPMRGVTLAVHESVGTIGIVCPEQQPLLAFISLMAPAIAMGNTVVMVPSQAAPLPATDFHQILETSDIPPGVVNIVTGDRDELATVLAEHDEVQSVWAFGQAHTAALVEKASAGNLKRTWTCNSPARDWFDDACAQGEEFLRQCVQVKNIWIPYGE